MLPRLHEMRVAAREVIPPQSSIVPDKASQEIAIVATLVSIALLSCLLRVYTHGRLLRTFAFDDGLALVAALSSIGVLVTFIGLTRTGVEDRQWGAAPGDDRSTVPWTLALSLLHIIGISMAKFSACFYLLRIFDRRYCCYLLYGLIALLLPSVLTWFGSTLLRCVPVAAAWDRSIPSGSHCMSWDTFTTFAMINNVINASTNLILVLLVVPIACSPPVSLKSRAMNIAVACIGLVACAAAIIRTKLLFDLWQDSYTTNETGTDLHLWSAIELTTALIAINLPTLPPLPTKLNSILPTTHSRPKISAPQLQNPSTPHASTHSRYSSQTVIYRPNTVYHPTNRTRFHDTESNLTFDIETQSSRTHTRTHTMQTRSRTHTMRMRNTGHSRNVSDWSQFSGFTYYTDPSEPPDLGRDEESEGSTELEEIIRSLGLDQKEGGVGGMEGTSDERVGDDEDAEESFHGGDGGGDGDIRLARTRKG
ncbi:hypothetical protein T440DRAFT_504755 [Plenodomus tracheiphilus IPT5]|uniref:Rhodopsin domain-containing protein n=1 Tax=Plenodomus tracheiphilus IPT5 TaxID=1408161 RepID=A0A6A7BLH2_9PLEO|nr:hypothetical protein T440DRAFT_504755 [Plenodomus tracheiphilus IPT5]